jgi:hypothetical protein
MAIASDIGGAAASNRPAHISAKEWALRIDLAACYRMFDHLGWTECNKTVSFCY